MNKNVGGHFRRNDEEELIDDQEDRDEENTSREKTEQSNEGSNSSMHLAHRKNLSMAFYGNEIIKEMEERGQTETTFFGPKEHPEDASKRISYKESFEQYMRSVDGLRRNELYEHRSEDCSPQCAKRGCGKVASVDGNWKINYKDRSQKKRNNLIE